MADLAGTNSGIPAKLCRVSAVLDKSDVFDVDAGESAGFFGGAEGALDAGADFDVGVFVIAETGGVLDGG